MMNFKKKDFLTYGSLDNLIILNKRKIIFINS